jgi:hypothetical protein
LKGKDFLTVTFGTQVTTRPTWKGFDWDAMNRLYEKGLISDPVGKAKSVVFTEEGLHRSGELFRKMFTTNSG